MTRGEAASFLRDELDKWNLKEWKVRISASGAHFLGLCSHKDKCIILNAHHVDIHPDEEIKNTIRHEIAHALTPGHAHDFEWQEMARKVGCTSITACSHLSLSPDIIDAIRSGADVEFTVEVETRHIPKYTVTRLQDKCKVCGKVAKEAKSITVENDREGEPNIRIVTLECGHVEIKKIPKGTPFHTLVSNEDLPEVKNCKHEWDKNHCVKCDQYKPFPFQIEGMKFVEQALAINKGVLICDEMGLGKTIQADGYLARTPSAFPVLFVVKSGVKFQILKEGLRWMGIRYVPQAIERSTDILIPGVQVYIVSYDILTPKERVNKKTGAKIKQGFDIQKFIDRGIKTLVLDECQQIKNTDATRTQQVRRLAKHMNVIALSGTPWKNKGSELFSVLNMLAPQKFPSQEAFIQRWVDFYYHGKYLKEGGIRNVKAFKEYTKDIIIRRERAEVMPELPTVTRTRNYTELEGADEVLYDEATSEFVKFYNDLVGGGQENTFGGYTNLLAQLSILRHVTALAKIPQTMNFLREFVEDTERKIVVFAHHIDVQHILVQQCQEEFGKATPEHPAIPVYYIKGGMPSVDRFEIQEKFNRAPRAILIASQLASGEGLNLQTGSDCIMHERQWNPANEEQCEGRFIRIGQQASVVSATYMTAADTVDDYLDKIVERKRIFFHAAMNRGEAPKWVESELVKELAETIVQNYNKKISGIKKFVQMSK